MKNGPTSPYFENKRVKLPDFYNMFQHVAKNKKNFLKILFFHIWSVTKFFVGMFNMIFFKEFLLENKQETKFQRIVNIIIQLKEFLCYWNKKQILGGGDRFLGVHAKRKS